jgi:hypothetical protein
VGLAPGAREPLGLFRDLDALPYVRERWAPEFELVHADLSIADPFQVVLTLRRG